MPTCLELISVTNVIFNFQSQVGAIPVFSCKWICRRARRRREWKFIVKEMALYSFVNTYSRNHLHPGFCRHFGQRNIAIWKTFIRPTCARALKLTSPLLAASCVDSTKQFSIWSKHSLLCACQKSRQRRCNVSLHKSVHCSRSLFIQEEVVAQRGEKLIESEMLDGNTTLDESSVSENVTQQCCQTSEVTVDTATENTVDTLNDTQTSSTKAMSKIKSSSQTPVTLTEGLFMFCQNAEFFHPSNLPRQVET